MGLRQFLKNQDCAPPLDGRGHRDLFGGGGGGGTTSTNTIQQSDPWSGVQPYLTDVLKRAQDQYNKGSYQGPYLASQSPYTLQAQQMMAAQAQDPNSLVSQGQNILGKTIAGDYLTVDGNPAIQAAIDAATRTVNKQFSGDNYGSSANKEWLARGAASAAAPILANERQNQLLAIGSAPAYQQANTAQLAGVGAAEEARRQAEIGVDQTKFNEPWNLLARYQQGIAGGLNAGGSSMTSGQTPFYSNPMANALGMGLVGLQLYNGLSSAGLLSSGLGVGTAALGGGGGVLAGMAEMLGPFALAL